MSGLRQFKRRIEKNDSKGFRQAVARELLVYGQSLDAVLETPIEASARVQVEGNIHVALTIAKKQESGELYRELLASLQKVKRFLNSNDLETLIDQYDKGQLHAA